MADNADLSFLKSDPVATAEKLIVDLRNELLKVKQQRDQEMLPWHERYRAACHEDEYRACSRRMREIANSYEGAILMLEQQIIRIHSYLPPRPIIITVDAHPDLG